MNKKAYISITILIGFVIGIFIIQPLGISLFLYDNQGDQGNYWHFFKIVFVQTTNFDDFDQILKSMLFGFLCSSFALMFYTRKKIFKLNHPMYDDTKINEFLQKGENHIVEFKSTLRWDLRQSKVNKAMEMVVAKTIAGFMNTKDGQLFIGVDDDGGVLGLQEDYATLKKPGRDGFEQYLMQLVSVSLGTHLCPLVKVAFYKLNERDICHLQVEKSTKPVYLNLGNRSHFFIRTGNGTRELDMPEALDYMDSHLN